MSACDYSELYQRAQHSVSTCFKLTVPPRSSRRQLHHTSCPASPKGHRVRRHGRIEWSLRPGQYNVPENPSSRVWPGRAQMFLLGAGPDTASGRIKLHECAGTAELSGARVLANTICQKTPLQGSGQAGLKQICLGRVQSQLPDANYTSAQARPI